MPYGSHCALTASPMYDTLLPFACACDPDLMVDDRPSAVILHPDHRNRFPPGLELLCEWANEHLQMDLGMGNEIRAWMNEPFCWDTLIAKIPRLAKGMKTSLEKLGSWLLIFLPGLMFSFYLLAAKESLLRMGSSLIDRCFGVFQGKKYVMY